MQLGTGQTAMQTSQPVQAERFTKALILALEAPLTSAARRASF